MTLPPSLLQFGQFILSAYSLAQWEPVSFLHQPPPHFLFSFRAILFPADGALQRLMRRHTVEITHNLWVRSLLLPLSCTSSVGGT